MQAARGASLKPLTVLALGIAALGVALDQWTKWLAVEHLADGRSRELVGELLQLQLTYNPGAAFGLGAGATVVLTLLALIATVVTLWFARQVGTPVWAIAVGLLVAGIGGNLIDRLARDPGPFRGHVVDFLRLPNWPIFNLADVFITSGAILIVIQFTRGLHLDGTREGAHAKDDE